MAPFSFSLPRIIRYLAVPGSLVKLLKVLNREKCPTRLRCKTEPRRGRRTWLEQTPSHPWNSPERPFGHFRLFAGETPSGCSRVFSKASQPAAKRFEGSHSAACAPAIMGGYSYLNATMGSTLAACQAGRNAATPATSATQPVATTKLSGSKAESS